MFTVTLCDATAVVDLATNPRSAGTRRNSMMRTSHSMDRRRNEVRKGDTFENMDAQSSSFEEKGHLQKWVKKTYHPDHNERLKGSTKVSSIEAHASDSGDSCVHMHADLE